MEDLKHAPFPHRLMKASKTNLNAEIYDIFKQVQINIPMLDAIKQIPSYAKFLKDLCTVKRKYHIKVTAMINESKVQFFNANLCQNIRTPVVLQFHV